MTTAQKSSGTQPVSPSTQTEPERLSTSQQSARMRLAWVAIQAARKRRPRFLNETQSTRAIITDGEIGDETFTAHRNAWAEYAYALCESVATLSTIADEDPAANVRIDGVATPAKRLISALKREDTAILNGKY